jgi:hypothetical protein
LLFYFFVSPSIKICRAGLWPGNERRWITN